MTFGQCVVLDTQQSGLITDSTSITNVVVAITAPLAGTLTILDGDGNTVITKGAGVSGAFAVPGQVDRAEFSLSSAADLGAVTVAFHPV
ncbi:hypothetical protein [Ralstonia thomasii]|jgi:hypothetical protein